MRVGRIILTVGGPDLLGLGLSLRYQAVGVGGFPLLVWDLRPWPVGSQITLQTGGGVEANQAVVYLRGAAYQHTLALESMDPGQPSHAMVLPLAPGTTYLAAPLFYLAGPAPAGRISRITYLNPDGSGFTLSAPPLVPAGHLVGLLAWCANPSSSWQSLRPDLWLRDPQRGVSLITPTSKATEPGDQEVFGFTWIAALPGEYQADIVLYGEGMPW